MRPARRRGGHRGAAADGGEARVERRPPPARRGPIDPTAEPPAPRARRGPALPEGCDPDSILLTFPVAREHAGQRVDRFIQSRIPRLSRTRAQEIVAACGYRPDGTRRRPSDRVKAGEVVLLVRPRFDEPDTPLSFEVLHEDDDLLAVDKPAGLPMHPTATYHRHTLTFLLRARYGDAPPHIAHRLDRETSGVVLCGKNLAAERALKRAFEERAVDKTYLAIVRGEFAASDGRIDLGLAPARDGLHVMMEPRAVADGGLSAVTRYEVLGRAGGLSLLHLFPETGRQHQLRVHLAALGHPIVGDKLYGPDREAPFLEFIETGMTSGLAARLGHERQALHAFSVSLAHPRTGARLSVRAPLADDLAALWERAGGGRLEWNALRGQPAIVPPHR